MLAHYRQCSIVSSTWRFSWNIYVYWQPNNDDAIDTILKDIALLSREDWQNYHFIFRPLSGANERRETKGDESCGQVVTILLSKSKVPSKLFTHGFIFSTKSVLSHSDLARAGLISALITTTEVIPWRGLCDTTSTVRREGRWLWQISDLTLALLDGLLKWLFSKLSKTEGSIVCKTSEL